MLFCFYNDSQQLVGRADGTSICPRNPIQEEGSYYKKGVEGDRKGVETPIAPEAPERSSSDWAEDWPPLTNPIYLSLIVKNTMLTVVHTLKPNSLTHSLQIHCIRLTSPRSHTSWACAENVTLQLASSMGRACALANVTVNHGGIKLPSVRVPRKDHFDGSAGYAKASSSFPRIHSYCHNSTFT